MSLRTFARAAANPVVSIGVAVVLVGGTGIATAATGGTFILGRANSATTQTFLTNPNGPALGLTSKAGTPPFTLGNTVKVPRLNSDYLDNLDSTQLQRRIAASCPGGAISGVSATGAVTCAALPAKVNASTGFGTEPSPLHTAVASVGGVTLNVACEVYDTLSPEGPRLRMTGYFTGNALVNGHVTTTPYSGDTTITPFGQQTPAAGMGANLPTLDAPELSVSRQSVLVMVDSGGKLSQWTLHLFADGRAFGSTSGKPCTVWGTVL